MKDRFFVATLSENNPELEAVTWFDKKPEAIREVWRRKAFYCRGCHILAKVLNVPTVADKQTGEKT
jgi:hypothetical protein